MKTAMECKAVEAAMPDLLFDPPAVPEAVRVHIAACVDCRTELDSMARTMEMLEAWEAPEPSPFWDARMGARLRNDTAPPTWSWAGIREHLRTRIWLSNHVLRPATAGVAAAALAVAAGGGTWLDLMLTQTPAPVAQASNTVRDLQSLNDNAQLFQQMSSLDDGGPNTGGAD